MKYIPIPKEELNDIALDMRFDILRMMKSCGRQNGHLGGCMSAVETLAVLYTQVMNINMIAHSEQPWSNRDRFIMSKGHAGIAMYAAMKHVGLVSQNMINGPIRGKDTVLYRHPKRNILYGIECSVGSLGMGIGYGIGLAESFRRKGASQKVFVMMGDGECDEGSVWEGAAYASHRRLDNLIVIIDKNGLQLDGPTQDVLSMDNMSQRWSAFGFQTVDIDGHNMDALMDAFHTRHPDRPLAVIAHTVKGKGMSFAENRTEWHDNYLSEELFEQGIRELGGVDLSEIRRKAQERFNSRKINLEEDTEVNVKLEESSGIIKQWNRCGSRNIVGEASNSLAEQDKKFTLIYADCANRIGIRKLQEHHPDKCYEAGISEQNAVSMAAAMAHEGFHVFAVAYAPFITARVLDQVRANLAYMKAPVCLIGLGAGMAGSDLGATHTAFEDIANMRGLPEMLVITPADTYEIAKGMEFFVNNPKPMYLRITVWSPDVSIYTEPTGYDPYGYDVVRGGKDAVVLTIGSILGDVIRAAEKLKYNGIAVEVVNVRSVKPLNPDLIDRVKEFEKIITVEEHCVIGGLGTAVSEVLVGKTEAEMKKIGIQNEYFTADEPNNIREKIGLTADGIASAIEEFVRT